MNFKQIQIQSAAETAYRERLIDSAVDMFDVVKDVGKAIVDRIDAGSNITIDRAEVYKIIDLTLKAELNQRLARIESAIDRIM